jgi:hypothetical protein
MTEEEGRRDADWTENGVSINEMLAFCVGF